MVKQGNIERRKSIRAKRILSLQIRPFRTRRKMPSKWILTTTEDMSMDGLSFYTEYEFTLGDLLDLVVVMAGALTIYQGYAEVVRVERKRTGVYFFTAVKFSSRVVKPSVSRKSIRVKSRKRV
jgi:hypothetical protein